MQQMMPEYNRQQDNMRKKARELLKKTDIKAWRTWLPGMIVIFLVSFADCFSVSCCFPLCFLLAYKAQTGKTPKGAGMGMLLAEGMRMIWGAQSTWPQTLAFLVLSAAIGKPVHDKRKVYALLLGAGLVCIFPVFLAEDALRTLSACIGLALSMGCMPAMLQVAKLMNEKKKNLSEDDLLCLALPVMLLLCGGCHVQIWAVNMGLCASFFLVISVGWVCGAMAGSAAGIGAGFAALMGNMHALYMIVLPFSGFMCGCLRRKNRLLCAGAFVFAGICASGAAMKEVPVPLLCNLWMGSILFAVLPERQLKKGMRLLKHLQWEKPRENAYMALRMRRWVKAIDRLTNALPMAQEPSVNIPLDAESIAEEVCDRCEMLPICWHEHYAETKKAMETLAACNETELGVINRNFSHCKRISRFPAVMDRIAEKRNAEFRRYAVAAYERDMLKTHLTALSQAAQMISMEGTETSETEREWLERAEEALQKMRFSGRIAFAKLVDGHRTLGIQCDMIALHPMMGEKLSEQLGAYLGTRLSVTEQNATQVLLEEKPPMAIMWGSATVCAADEHEYGKGERQENGDAVKVRFLPGGKVLVALSDGMGHGEQAKLESRNTLDMLCGCIEAGYTCQQAMKAVNGAMLSSTGGEIFATVDVCLMDLWTGKVSMHKLGAAGSAVIQGQKGRWITGAALPLGIMEDVLPTEKEMNLAEGDRLLLFSDGITDPFDGEQELMMVVQRHLEECPQEMAQSMMEEAMARDGGYPRDDMTAVCLQVISSFPERKRRAGVI